MGMTNNVITVFRACARVRRARSDRGRPQARLSEERMVWSRTMLVPKDVSARGARIRFVEAGAGKPLVLLHDCGATHETFGEVIAQLAGTFRVIAPDLPGFG